jgi:putative ABC transport system ATP-binding protein
MSSTTTTTEETQAQETKSDAVIEATDLTRTYGEGDYAVQALRGCSIEVRRGELTAVMGPSGSGKSTLMHDRIGVHRRHRHHEARGQ